MKRATRREAERKWLIANRQQLEQDYPGRWIAVQGSELIAMGNSRDDVARKAVELGVEAPFITALRKREFQDVFLIRQCL